MKNLFALLLILLLSSCGKDLVAENLSLNCHAGHGLNFENVVSIAKIKNILELNIGHFIIADSIFNGLQNSIQKMKKIINEAAR